MWRAMMLFVGAIIAAICSANTLSLDDAHSTLPGVGQLRITSTTGVTHDVMVKRVNDTLTLVCADDRYELENVVWYLPRDDTPYRANSSERELSEHVHNRVSVWGAVLQVSMLRLEDTGYYTCEVPPFTVSKYTVVQPPAVQACAHGGFTCGWNCVLPLYVCDGHPDCPHGEDEGEHACGKKRPCDGKLMCPDGRCISAEWCWEGRGHAHSSHSCCALYSAPLEPDAPSLGDPLRPPPDYAHIQSTIYTVTACALIFMVAVVLLVSAIYKMHMKRAVLRSYARATRAADVYPPCQLPPCYSTHQASLACPEDGSCSDGCADEPPALASLTRPRSLAWLPQYGRVPQRDTPVERLLHRMTVPGDEYRVDPLEHRFGRDSRCADSVTLRLGRFRVSVPRLARARTRRPDTPDVEMLHASELEMLRDAGDTYTLNGRTIRLLGAELQCPAVGGNVGDPATFVGRVVAPPPYCAVVSAAPAKVLGPPPAYLSREDLVGDAGEGARDGNANRVSVASTSSAAEQQRDCNGNVAEAETCEAIEPPPSYNLIPEPADNGNND